MHSRISQCSVHNNYQRGENFLKNKENKLSFFFFFFLFGLNINFKKYRRSSENHYVIRNMSEDMTNKWIKQYSKTYNTDYWYNLESGKSVWEKPIDADDESVISKKRKLENDTTIKNEEITKKIQKERDFYSVNFPKCPREINRINIPSLVNRLRNESAKVEKDKENHFIVFTLPDDDPSLVSRAIQEDQILKTRLKLKKRDKVVDLPSFWEVWENNENFRNEILKSSDPYEAKWELQRKYEYKIATTFMPGYAKAIYEYFNAKDVLDPCAGWGDRLLG